MIAKLYYFKVRFNSIKVPLYIILYYMAHGHESLGQELCVHAPNVVGSITDKLKLRQQLLLKKLY